MNCIKLEKSFLQIVPLLLNASAYFGKSLFANLYLHKNVCVDILKSFVLDFRYCLSVICNHGSTGNSTDFTCIQLRSGSEYKKYIKIKYNLRDANHNLLNDYQNYTIAT